MIVRNTVTGISPTCDADFLEPLSRAREDVICCMASEGDTGAAYDFGLK